MWCLQWPFCNCGEFTVAKVGNFICNFGLFYFTTHILSGKTPKEVASEYSLSETAVRNWTKKKAPINAVEGYTTNLEEINRVRKKMLGSRRKIKY